MAPKIGRTLVNRTELADRLTSLLVPGGPDIGVVGPGGFGKTTLVTQACQQLEEVFSGGILWVTLGEQVPDPILADKLNDLSEMLSGRRPKLTDPTMAGHRLGELMADRGPVLLVIDDLWQASRLAPFPSGPTVTRVITTRANGSLPAGIPYLRVGRMNSVESAALLGIGVPGLESTERLTKLTGGWPLLMAMANGALRAAVEHGAAPDHAADLIADQLMEDGPRSLDLDSADLRELAVEATVEASLRRLGGTDRGRFLELGIFPEDIEIPAGIVYLLWATSGLDASASRRLHKLLVDLSLIDASGDSLRIHDVLRTYVRQTLAAPGLAEANSRMVSALRAQAHPGWDSAQPYTLRHLAGHAAEAGELDSLLTDAGFLLFASQPELLANLGAARSQEAQTAALVYQRTAHHLRDQNAADRPAYLGLAAHRAGARTLADAANEQSRQARWRCSWAHWNEEPDHRILTRHEEAVVDVAIAPLPDGRVWIITRCLDSRVRIVDLASNESVTPPWLASARPITAIACVPMPGGRHVVVADSWDQPPQVWDLESGETPEWQIPELGGGCKEITWTEYASRPTLVIQYWDQTIRAWDPATGRQVGKTLSFELGPKFYFSEIAAGVLPNGHLGIAVANESAPIRLWDLETGKCETTLVSPHPRTMALAWGRHGLFSAGDATDIQQWDIQTGKPVGAGLVGHAETINNLHCASIPGYGEVLISGDDDGTIRLWDAKSGDSLGEPVAAHAGSIRALACAPLDGGQVIIVSGGNENTARLWNLQVFTDPPPSPVTLSPVTSVAHDGARMVSGHEDGVVRIWEAHQVALELVTPSEVSALACHGQYGVSGHLDGVTRVWDLTDGRQMAVLGDHGSRTTWSIACCSLDGDSIAVTGRQSTVLDAWSLQSGDRLWQARLPLTTKWEAAGVFFYQICPAVAFATLPDGRQVVVAGSRDGTIRVLDLKTGARIGRNMNAREPDQPSPATVSALACTRLPDGREVAIAGSEDGPVTVAVWDLATRRIVARNSTQTSWVRHAVCTTLPDGSPVAVTGDTLLRVWPLVGLAPDADWIPALEIDLDAPVTALDLAPDGSLVAGTKHGLARLSLQLKL